MNKTTNNLRKITVTAVMAALSSVLMFISFSVPFMPEFIKLDFSELPALITAFAIGPFWGGAVCLIKNLVNLLFTHTAGIGELSNFILGVLFVVPAGLIYKHRKTRATAIWGSVAGALIMAVVSIFTNYYIMYPIYSKIMPMETIIGMYKAINPAVDTLWQALVFFNMPFTFFKGLCSVVVTMLIYKRISHIIKGK